MLYIFTTGRNGTFFFRREGTCCCPPGHGMLHATEAGHANLCGVVCRARGRKPPLREVGPPEQSQRGLRGPLAQLRPSAAPKKESRPSQTRVFIPLCIPNHTSTKFDQVTTSLRISIAVSPSLLPARGSPGLRQPTQEIPGAI